MDDDVTVTVGIPTKNEAITIGSTMMMLNEQTRPPDRVILADDSDDPTVEIARMWALGQPYDLEVIGGGGGVGAARQAILEAAPPGLLCCLDAQVEIADDWVETHVNMHEMWTEPCVLSGTWPGYTAPLVLSPHDDIYFVEANCSMLTETAKRLGGWDPAFQRGCDWDFRIRLAQSDDVTAVASTRVGARPMESNSSGIKHLQKKMNRATSLPFLRKYGRWYAAFHPMHILGDVLGASAILALLLTAVHPAALAWVLACIGLYGLTQTDKYGWRLTDRLVGSLGIFVMGYTATRELVAR